MTTHLQQNKNISASASATRAQQCYMHALLETPAAARNFQHVRNTVARARVQAEDSFKSLRRKLPKTKQEFNWQVSCVLRMLLLLLLLMLLLGCNHFSRMLFKVNLKEYGVMTDSRCQCQQQQQQQQQHQQQHQ